MTKSKILQVAKPILFNTGMVRSILDGRKTVTRRVIKPRYRDDEYGFCVCTNKTTGEVTVEKIDEDEGTIFLDGNTRYVNPPYKPGQYLYIRETWNHGYFDSSDIELDNSRWFEEYPVKWNGLMSDISGFIYRADFTKNEEYEYGTEDEKGNLKKIPWKPSIHMPKEAARIFLKVMDVRAERLQDMKYKDFLSEGLKLDMCVGISACGGGCYDCPANSDNLPKMFMSLWNSTIKKQDLDKYGWEANPWVWVIRFERVEVDE